MTDELKITELSIELENAKRAYKNAMKKKWIAEIKHNKIDLLETIFRIKYHSQKYIEKNEELCCSSYERANDKILSIIQNDIPSFED